MQGLQMIINRLVFLGALWAVLMGVDLKALIIGAIAVPAATWMSLRLLPGEKRLVLWRLALHLPLFVAGSVRGGVDVARRAFSPRMPLHPGWIEVPVRLPGAARAVLGGELSLMPGTLAAGTDRDSLLIHLLDTQADAERGIERSEAAISAIIDDR